MKRPDFPLLDAIAWFVADKPLDGEGIAATTLRSYERRLAKFHLWLDVEHRVLRSVQIETAERFVRTAKNLNTRRNLAITLRSFATYLARKKLWVRLSALHDLAIPKPSARGLPPYKDDEIAAILRGIDGSTAVRDRAIIAVELHGFRAKEARLMLRRNVVFPKVGEAAGHFLIEDEAGTKRVRLSALHDLAIPKPSARGLPPYKDDEIAAILRGIDGSTAVRDRAIIEVHGWDRSNSGSGMRMLRRYRGEIPVSRLKQYPSTLGKFFGRAS